MRLLRLAPHLSQSSPADGAGEWRIFVQEWGARRWTWGNWAFDRVNPGVEPGIFEQHPVVLGIRWRIFSLFSEILGWRFQIPGLKSEIFGEEFAVARQAPRILRADRGNFGPDSMDLVGKWADGAPDSPDLALEEGGSTLNSSVSGWRRQIFESRRGISAQGFQILTVKSEIPRQKSAVLRRDFRTLAVNSLEFEPCAGVFAVEPPNSGPVHAVSSPELRNRGPPRAAFSGPSWTSNLADRRGDLETTTTSTEDV